VNAVQERALQMMRRFFEANDWKAEADPDGSGFALRFKEDADTGCVTMYRFWVNDGYFVLSSWNDRYIDPQELSRALAACNTWNAEQGFGAYAWVRFREEEKTAELRIATGGLPLPKNPDSMPEEDWMELLTLRWQVCEDFWKFIHQHEKITQVAA
jgi:hypothetical protein